MAERSKAMVCKTITSRVRIPPGLLMFNHNDIAAINKALAEAMGIDLRDVMSVTLHLQADRMPYVVVEREIYIDSRFETIFEDYTLEPKT